MKFNLKTVGNSITRGLGKTSAKVAKVSPEITFVLGAVGVVVAMVEVGRATTKLDEVMEPVNEQLDRLATAIENPEEILPEGAVYTEKDYKHDVAITYVKAGVSMAKLYLPAVLIASLSIASLATSNHILRKRNVALTAAYATLDKSYKAYRARVVERLGADMDKELRYDIKQVQVEEKVVDDKGKEKVVKKTIDVADPELSDYAEWFDETTSVEYEKSSMDYNKEYITQQVKLYNQMLKAKGKVFLNELRQTLGFEPSKEGQIVGWVYDPECPLGDNKIEVSIVETHRKVTDEVTGQVRYIPTLLLDYNVDGNVWQLLN